MDVVMIVVEYMFFLFSINRFLPNFLQAFSIFNYLKMKMLEKHFKIGLSFLMLYMFLYLSLNPTFLSYSLSV